MSLKSSPTYPHCIKNGLRETTTPWCSFQAMSCWWSEGVLNLERVMHLVSVVLHSVTPWTVAYDVALVFQAKILE